MNAPIVNSLTKADPNQPAITVIGPSQVAVRAGVVFNGHAFAEDTPVPIDGALEAGTDYLVIAAGGELHLGAARGAFSLIDNVLGGFHFAPGGNATGTSGGDTTPAINPFSLWDRNFRPAAPDPRGMTRVELPGGRSFWCDIYLTAADHLEGTSRFGVTIADGDNRPRMIGAKDRSTRFDYDTAVALLAHHGKQLLSVEEFFAAAYGVTERTAAGKDPKKTSLDAPRTSRWGLMQATGNLWTWGHDGHPDLPRASLFGGSWLHDDNAGSRYANVAYVWPGNSNDSIGARGRCDHLQPV